MEWIPGPVFRAKRLQLLIALILRSLQLLVLLGAAAATGFTSGEAGPSHPTWPKFKPCPIVQPALSSQVEISLQPDKKTILLGEPMFLSVHGKEFVS